MARSDWATVWTLATKHLVVRRARGLVLLLGFAVGAGVMMVLLAVGDAMLVQSRDVALVGGGEVTILPEGIDLEGLRTGSMAGMFFGIDRARFVGRQVVGGGRLGDVVRATSPMIEHKLVYLRNDDQTVPLRAGGEIPSAARAVGAGLTVTAGRWDDSDDDRRFLWPTQEQLYHELDRFHQPLADSAWAEWHYFNVAVSANEWWYLTYLVGGPPDADGRRGGQLLVTRHRAGRAPASFETRVAPSEVRLDTTRADLILGADSVIQREGRYRLRGTANGTTGTVRFELELSPTPNAYFPAVEVISGGFPSGYVVPVVRGTVTGTLCEGPDCRRLDKVPGYHDHNWGVWKATTWNWGQARGATASLVYGGVLNDADAPSNSRNPYFLAVVDSLGIEQVLRFRELVIVPRSAGDDLPSTIAFTAGRDRDSLRVEVRVLSVQETSVAFGGRRFLQMRGAFTAGGTLLGRSFADSGLGFFETFLRR